KADADTTAIPIIVLSAHASSDARDKAFAAGCEEFETKPVNWDTLFKKIDTVIAKAIERAQELERAKAAEAAAAAAAAAKASAPEDDEVDFGGGTSEKADPSALTNVRRSPLPGVECEGDVCAVQPKRILVVEDNDANRVMLCRRLNKNGYMTT